MRILSVVGARPQFVKLAPIAQAMAGRAEHLIVHTGQHYDDLMSDVFFRDLGIPAPDYNLGVGSGKHGEQTGLMMAGLERVFDEAKPDAVLVYGDTNSTLAATLAAVKMHIPVAHLEAGLRSFNRRMPEEHNRVLTDHAADILLSPTQIGMDHLASEGLADRAILVGDVMTDVLYRIREQSLATNEELPWGLSSGQYYVCTIHRPDNTDDPERLRAIVDALGALNKPVLLLAHPRLRALAEMYGINLGMGSLILSEPFAYPQLIHAAANSAGVVTDSGGLQKEAFLLRVPCTTIRTETEWTETVDLGWNVLVDDLTKLASTVERPAPRPTDETPYGDGNAAIKTVNVLLHKFGNRLTRN